MADLRDGSYVLVASAVGFVTVEKEIEVEDGQSLFIHFELEEAVVPAGDVVVTGTLVETYVKDSPVKVDVVSPHYLRKSLQQISWRC